MSLLSCPCALPASAVTAVVLRRYPVAIMRTKYGRSCCYGRLRQIQSKPKHPFLKTHFNIITHLPLGLPGCPFTLDLPTKSLYAPLLFSIRATRPAHLILFYFITSIIFSEHRLCSSFTKEIYTSSTFICPVLYNFLPDRKLNYRCVQFKTCHLAVLFIMHSQFDSVRVHM